MTAAEEPRPDEGPPIEVRGLVSRFGDHVVHDGLDLTVNSGEVLAAVRLLQPDDGAQQDRLARARTADISYSQWSGIERRWGVLFQHGALFTALTVKENIMAPMREHTDLSLSEQDELADLKIALVGLPISAGSLKPAELSGGMIKRAALARALALDPELVFLDEPTSGLDPIGAAAFDDLIRDLSESLNLTVFMITHDLDSLYAITDRVAVIADKKIVADGPVAELERSEHPWIREYFLGPRGRAAVQAHKRGARGKG